MAPFGLDLQVFGLLSPLLRQIQCQFLVRVKGAHQARFSGPAGHHGYIDDDGCVTKVTNLLDYKPN